jgi:dUTPase
MSALRLFIAPTNPAFYELYLKAADAYNTTPYAERNSGFDMYCDTGSAINTQQHATFVEQGCRALAVDSEGRTRAYWLAPRSSISKTPLRLANSMGLIDATYRGVIIAAFTLPHPGYFFNEHKVRLCQLAAPDLFPWAEVIVVDELPGPVTTRGEGGFGSTG